MTRKKVNAFIKEMKEEHQLRLVGRGGGMMYDVEEVMLAFDSSKKLTVNEARELYINATEELLARFNNDEQIRPYLHNYPFNINNLTLNMTFSDRIGHFQPDKNYVSLLFVANGNIFYEWYDEVTDKICVLHQEPYEEAVKIVKSKGIN